MRSNSCEMGVEYFSIWMALMICLLLNFPQKLDGKSSEDPIGSISKQKAIKDTVIWEETRLL